MSDFRWLSSDSSTVSVTAFGVVQAIKPGKATIKVLSVYDSLNYDEVMLLRKIYTFIYSFQMSSKFDHIWFPKSNPVLGLYAMVFEFKNVVWLKNSKVVCGISILVGHVYALLKFSLVLPLLY